MSLITVGWTYKFSFIPIFSALDGVYTIAKIYSWNEVLSEQLSLFDLLYSPLNIPTEKYNEDINVYRHEPIYKLISPIDGSVQYIPESITGNKPIYAVKEYFNLALTMPLGTYADEAGLSYLSDHVGDQIRSTLGITGKALIATVGKTYLTEEEYGKIDAARKQIAAGAQNHYAALLAAQKEIDRLRAQVAGYQRIIEEELGG